MKLQEWHWPVSLQQVDEERVGHSRRQEKGRAVMRLGATRTGGEGMRRCCEDASAQQKAVGTRGAAS